MLEALISKFAQIEDPRCDWRVEHKLLDILVIAVCAVIGEAESFEDIALYGRCKRDWLGRFLELPGGIPSHDTFRRVLMLIDPECVKAGLTVYQNGEAILYQLFEYVRLPESSRSSRFER